MQRWYVVCRARNVMHQLYGRLNFNCWRNRIDFVHQLCGRTVLIGRGCLLDLLFRLLFKYWVGIVH